MKMPEETNRVMADHVSDMLFAWTEVAKGNLLREGISRGIYVTGNTIVDAIHQTVEFAGSRAHVLRRFGLDAGDFAIATVHRQENVDDRGRLTDMLTGLLRVAWETAIPVVVPVHPRTQKRIDEFGLDPRGITCVSSLGFLDPLRLESNVRLALTDSGGVQEETCILRVPCVTLRKNTERPETLRSARMSLLGQSQTRWSSMRRPCKRSKETGATHTEMGRLGRGLLTPQLSSADCRMKSLG